jgi:hypothetical protein
MDINEAYPSKYIDKTDLAKSPGQQIVLVIGNVTIEIMDEATGETKPVVSFAGTQKGLPLNKTNANVLAGAFGPETDGWRGRSIVLYYDPNVVMKGQITGGLRLRLPDNAQPAAAPAPVPAPVPAPAQPVAATLQPDQPPEDPEGEIPF